MRMSRYSILQEQASEPTIRLSGLSQPQVLQKYMRAPVENIILQYAKRAGLKVKFRALLYIMYPSIIQFLLCQHIRNLS